MGRICPYEVEVYNKFNMLIGIGGHNGGCISEELQFSKRVYEGEIVHNLFS